MYDDTAVHRFFSHVTMCQSDLTSERWPLGNPDSLTINSQVQPALISLLTNSPWSRINTLIFIQCYGIHGWNWKCLANSSNGSIPWGLQKIHSYAFERVWIFHLNSGMRHQDFPHLWALVHINAKNWHRCIIFAESKAKGLHWYIFFGLQVRCVSPPLRGHNCFVAPAIMNEFDLLPGKKTNFLEVSCIREPRKSRQEFCPEYFWYG